VSKPFVPSVPFVIALAVGFACVVACDDQGSVNVDPDATLDQSSPLCVTDKECSNGDHCSYAPVGCGSKGECRTWQEPDSAFCTTPATTACGCNGKTVQIPPCWNGFSPQPVLASGQLKCDGG
jgi:hypothetical protein